LFQLVLVDLGGQNIQLCPFLLLFGQLFFDRL
jgi:hypothetical protein